MFRPSDVGLLAVTANNIITVNKVNNAVYEVVLHKLSNIRRNRTVQEINPCFFFSSNLQDQNVFDSKKKVKLTNAEGVEHKLAKKQLQAIELNKALLAMYTNQVTSAHAVP